jgi:hypothetical protein
VSNWIAVAAAELMIIGGTSRKPQLLAIDLVMIIEDWHQFVAHVAMGLERARPHVEATEVMARIGQSSGQLAERQPTTPDVQRRIQVSTDRIEVAVGEVVIGDLADQKEIPLAFLF